MCDKLLQPFVSLPAHADEASDGRKVRLSSEQAKQISVTG